MSVRVSVSISIGAFMVLRRPARDAFAGPTAGESEEEGEDDGICDG